MPRLARIDAPGVVHHVIIRGIERKPIFRDNQDRDDLVERLSTLLDITHISCYAWSFLSNHAHFLFRTGESDLATLMRRLLTGYAVTFNRRHHRHGQLFQNRYKSIICQEDTYLTELVRYIHLNPLRAKVVYSMEELNEYAYCGHSVVMGRQRMAWQDTDYVLAYFAQSKRAAKEHYLQYIQEGIEQGRRPDLVGGGLIRSLGGWDEVKKIKERGQARIKGDERILGASDFVNEILNQAEDNYTRKYQLKAMGYNLRKLEDRIEEIFQVKRDDLYVNSRQKDRVEARSVLFYWAVQELGMPGTELAKLFGMSQPGVAYALRKGERIVKEKEYQLTI
jgi:REP element-mobilizing transposase RayT